MAVQESALACAIISLLSLPNLRSEMLHNLGLNYPKQELVGYTSTPVFDNGELVTI